MINKTTTSFVALLVLAIFIFFSSGCAETSESKTLAPTPTSSVPGFSLGNPAEFGTAIIQYFSEGSPYMEVRPIASMQPANSIVTLNRGDDPLLPGNEYVVVYLSFSCVTGAGEENDCNIGYTSLNIINPQGTTQQAEIAYFSEVTIMNPTSDSIDEEQEWHFFNPASWIHDEYALSEGEEFSGATVIQVKKGATGLVLSYDGISPLFWKLP